MSGYRLDGDDVQQARLLASVCDGEILNEVRLSAIERADPRLIAIYTLAAEMYAGNE